MSTDRITLAEVLLAYDADVEMRLLGPLAVRYILQNRAALERLELENAARAACIDEPTTDNPVLFVPGNRDPELIEVVDTDDTAGPLMYLVIVGRDWRPGVNDV